METFGERFKVFLGHIKQNPTQFATTLGKSPTIFLRIINEETKPSYEILELIFKKHPQLSRDWLLLGIGEMLIKEDKGEAYQEELRELRQMKNFLMAEIEMYREREKKFLQLGKFNGVHPIAVLEVAA